MVSREIYEVLNSKVRIKLSCQILCIPYLSLPEWSQFVELVRQILDVPIEVNKSPLLIREVAWFHLMKSDDIEFAKFLAASSPQGARFAFLGLDYICRAAKLPAEFGKILGDKLLHIQIPK